MPRIIYKDKNAVAIVKPVGMPSQSDKTGDLDAMSATAKMLLDLGESDTLWLVHRLDRTVGGVMVFARTKNAAAQLSRYITDGTFTKEYLAVIEGECEGGEMRDYLFKDSVKSKSFVVDGARKGAKLAVLNQSTVQTKEVNGKIFSLVKINLITGRFHQIRAQFSARSHPLLGDKKYGSRDEIAKTPALFATSVLLKGVNGGKAITAVPDKEKYPWSLFDL